MSEDPGMAELTGTAHALLRDAAEAAKARGHGLVGTEHILLAMTQQSPGSFARRALDEVGVTERLRSHIESLIGGA